MLVVKNLGKEEMIKCPNEDQGIVKKIFLAARIVVGVKNFWVYFIDYFRLSNEPFVQYNLRNGLRLKTRNKTSDRNLINEIFIKKDYTKSAWWIWRANRRTDTSRHIRARESGQI